MSTRPTPLCPVCGKPATTGPRPFCSPRCAEIDLGRWLTGQYRVPAAADDFEDQPPPRADTPDC